MIYSGHKLSEVKQYTLNQLFGFFHLAKKRERKQTVTYMDSTRASVWAGDKDYRKVLKEFK